MAKAKAKSKKSGVVGRVKRGAAVILRDVLVIGVVIVLTGGYVLRHAH